MLKNREELRKAREMYSRYLKAEKRRVLVCAGTGCVSGGSMEIFERLSELVSKRGMDCQVELKEEPHDNTIGMKKSGCHGFCEMGPLVRIEPEGYLYTKVKLEDCEEIVDRTIVAGEHIERLAYKQNGVVYKKQDEIPFYKKQTRLVLEHCGQMTPHP